MRFIKEVSFQHVKRAWWSLAYCICGIRVRMVMVHWSSSPSVHCLRQERVQTSFSINIHARGGVIFNSNYTLLAMDWQIWINCFCTVDIRLLHYTVVAILIFPFTPCVSQWFHQAIENYWNICDAVFQWSTFWHCYSCLTIKSLWHSTNTVLILQKYFTLKPLRLKSSLKIPIASFTPYPNLILIFHHDRIYPKYA